MLLITFSHKITEIKMCYRKVKKNIQKLFSGKKLLVEIFGDFVVKRKQRKK